jgi:hypothetical protein
METAKEVAILINPGDHTQGDLQDAKRRFRELFVVELSMVEAKEVEKKWKP